MSVVDPIVAIAAACEQIRTGDIEEVQLEFINSIECPNGDNMASQMHIIIRKNQFQPVIQRG